MCLKSTEAFSSVKLFVTIMFICCFSLTENICVKIYDHEFKIALVGDRGVGKTQIIKQFVDGKLDTDYIPTTLLAVSHTDYIFNNKTIRISIYDIPGDIDNIVEHKTILQDVNAVLVVYDVTNEHSFNNFENWAQTVGSMMTCNQAKFILVGNKVDSDDDSRVISTSTAENRAFFQGYGFMSQDSKQLFSFFEVSATKNIGIADFFTKIIISLCIGETLQKHVVVEELPSGKNTDMQNNKKCCYACTTF